MSSVRVMVLPLKFCVPSFTNFAKPASWAAVEISNASSFASYQSISISSVPPQTSEGVSVCAVICKDKKDKRKKVRICFIEVCFMGLLLSLCVVETWRATSPFHVCFCRVQRDAARHVSTARGHPCGCCSRSGTAPVPAQEQGMFPLGNRACSFRGRRDAPRRRRHRVCRLPKSGC